MKENLRSVGSVLAMAVATVASAVPVFNVVSIPPIPGGSATIGRGVNNAGWVVGQADGGFAFVYHDGASEALPLLENGSDASATSINSSNVIVGSCRDVNGISRPVKWELVAGSWTITDLGTLAAGDAGFGVATRINDAGQIVGYASVASPGPYRGFIMTNGVKTDIGTLGFGGNFAYSQALGLNESGDVSGFAYATLQGPEHGLLYTADRGGQDITPQERFGLAQWHNVNNSGLLGGYISGTITGGEFRPATYDRFGNGYSIAPQVGTTTGGYGYDLNDSGALVGTMFYLDADPNLSIFLAFLYENETSTDLNSVAIGLPGVMTEATDVSNSGLIVGTADTFSGPQAVLLIPGVACPADFNADGVLDFFDYLDFVAAFSNSDISADYNNDAVVDFFDYLDFVQAFADGC